MTISKETTILELSNISKCYTINKPIFQNISFSVKEGEIIAITGNNGSGKSTLLRIIAGLDQKYNGNIQYRKKPHLKPSTDIILLHQTYDQLFPWLTVEKNITKPLRATAKISSEQAKTIAHSKLSNVGIQSDYFNSYPYQLSGGQKQKVALARALALNADILLMDEPFTALDEISRSNFHSMIKSLSTLQNKTILLVSHSSQEVDALANNTICLNQK